MRSVRHRRVGGVGGGGVFSVVENVAGRFFSFFDGFGIGDLRIYVARVGCGVGICFVHKSSFLGFKFLCLIFCFYIVQVTVM